MKATRKVWVIMDKGHKAIACGTTRNRHLQMIDGDWSMRLITYTSKGKAEAGFKVSQFYLGNAEKYMEDTYGVATTRVYHNGYTGKDETITYKHVDQSSRFSELYEAVEAEITLEA